MTATEVLRRLLDERGVEWEDASPVPSMHPWKTSYISFTGEEVTISCYDEPKWLMGTMVFLTPEQAIAATLRQAVRHPKPHEQWTTVLLPEIAWGWDDSWPDYLSVAHDTHGEWRTYVPEATLGTGTCHVESSIIDTYEYNRWEYELSCGHTIIWEDSEPPRYCPECGAKVVEPTTNDVGAEVDA